jgi:molecular chaperone GrpE (heat shock protein)
MEGKYKGMTVNERLYVSGLINEFDKAVSRKDAEKVRDILERVELIEESIRPILEKLGVTDFTDTV